MTPSNSLRSSSTIKVKKRKTEHNSTKTALEKVAIAGAVFTSAGATVSATGAVVKKQLSAFDKSLWNPAFSQTAHPDTPVNQMVFICGHNSGTEAGSGTQFFNQNQTLSPYDLLSKTPVRALEFQVENDHGTLITNHGAALGEVMIDRSVSNPETLNSQLDSVKQWLSEPTNSDQVIVIELGNNAHNPHDQRAIDELLRKTFGNQLFDMHDYYKAENNGSWPTMSELAKDNKHVIVLASGMGSYNATIPSHEVMTDFLSPHANAPLNMQWHACGEDRTLLGNLIGNTATSSLPQDQQFVGSLNTDQVDHIIEGAKGQGAFIKLDQLSPNDPRLVAPDLRDQLATDPNVSLLNGLIQVDRGFASAAIFGIGVAADVGSGVFAVSESALKAYQNFKFIKLAKDHLKEAILNTSLVDLTSYQQRTMKTKTSYPLNFSTSDLTNYCREKLSSKITTDTVVAGAIGSTSIAGSIFSAGILFPLAFPVTSVLAIITLAAGAIITSIATYLNRRALNKKLDEVFDNPEIKKQIELKTATLKATINAAETTKYEEKINAREIDNKLSSASIFLLGTTLILRIGAIAKFAIGMIGTIASGLTTIAMFFKSALDAVMNYRNRQTHMENIPQLITQATLPAIDGRSYIFFGETPFEKYIRKYKTRLFNDHDLPKEFKKLTERELVKKLGSGAYKNQLAAIRKEAITNLIGKDLRAFCIATYQKYEPGNDALMKAYLQNRVGNYIASDVRASGRINTFKVALATWIGGSFFAPVMAGIFAGLALVIMAVGEIVTRIVSNFETEKFKMTAGKLIDQAISNETNKSPAASEIASFLGFMKSELKNNSLEKSSDKIPLTETSTTKKVHSHISQHKKYVRLKEESTQDGSLQKTEDKAHGIKLFKNGHSKKPLSTTLAHAKTPSHHGHKDTHKHRYQPLKNKKAV